MHCVEVYQMNLSLVKRDKTFGQIMLMNTIPQPSVGADLSAIRALSPYPFHCDNFYHLSVIYIAKIKATLLHIDCKIFCQDEPALRIDRRTRFQHDVQGMRFPQIGLEACGIVVLPGREQMQVNLE